MDITHFIIRRAQPNDLDHIVRLEARLFGSACPTFRSDTIRAFYVRCPDAFRVVVNGQERMMGYCALFPISEDGQRYIDRFAPCSVIEMPISSVLTTFNDEPKALYLEVIAASPDAPLGARIALLRHVHRYTVRGDVPTYTCPITIEGLQIVERTGFRAVDSGSGLFVMDPGTVNVSPK